MTFPRPWTWSIDDPVPAALPARPKMLEQALVWFLAYAPVRAAARLGHATVGWAGCPNLPPCPHPGVLHDVADHGDPLPRCCVDGCSCGTTPL